MLKKGDKVTLRASDTYSDYGGINPDFLDEHYVAGTVFEIRDIDYINFNYVAYLLSPRLEPDYFFRENQLLPFKEKEMEITTHSQILFKNLEDLLEIKRTSTNGYISSLPDKILKDRANKTEQISNITKYGEIQYFMIFGSGFQYPISFISQVLNLFPAEYVFNPKEEKKEKEDFQFSGPCPYKIYNGKKIGWKVDEMKKATRKGLIYNPDAKNPEDLEEEEEF